MNLFVAKELRVQIVGVWSIKSPVSDGKHCLQLSIPSHIPLSPLMVDNVL